MEGILIVTVFLTSTLSGVIGMGGGILLLTVMAEFLAPIDLIPLHGIVQLTSNSTRALFNFKHIDWKIIKTFLIGTIIGAAIGSQFVLSLPQQKFMLVIGIAVLLLTWKPKIKNAKPFKGLFFILGLVTSFLSLFVGATGPILAPFFIHTSLKKHGIIATKAACQFWTHTFKLLTFIVIGFNFHQYIPLLIGMTSAAALGSYCGKFLLGKLPEKVFLWIFRVVITILASRLIYKNI